jgi:hypothetical protein
MSNETQSYADFVNMASYRVRSLFYLLSPNETFYEKAEDVPNLTMGSLNTFFVFMFIEQFIFYLKHGRFNGKVNDHVVKFTYKTKILLELEFLGYI